MLMASGYAIASSGHGHKAPKKVGVLLVAFGSSEASAQVSFENISKKVKAAYPKGQTIIRSTKDPIKKDSHLVVLYGNLAPQGAVAKKRPPCLLNTDNILEVCDVHSIASIE